MLSCFNCWTGPRRLAAVSLLLGLLSLLAHEATARRPASRPTPPRLGKVLGADSSFLPQLEARSLRFSDQGVDKDAIQILKDHHFNYIRPISRSSPGATRKTWW